MAQFATASSRTASRVITAHQQLEGGGFVVRRPLGGEVAAWDPFLMLDHFGPVTYGPGEAVGAPDHPHRGFETVTYILKGGLHHQDSAGNEGNLTDGWVQWMTAGSGVVHSEMPTEMMLAQGGGMEGFQLWVNLPAKDKMVPPRYQDTPPENIPVVQTEDGQVRIKVIAGSALETTAVIETRTPMQFLDMKLQPGAHFTQPVAATANAFVYVYRGAGSFGLAPTVQLAEIGQAVFFKSGSGTQIDLQAGVDGMACLLLAGEPINEPVARYGPFVMNTEAEIVQAFEDYRSGKLGAIEGVEERYAKTKEAVKTQKSSGRWRDDF